MRRLLVNTLTVKCYKNTLYPKQNDLHFADADVYNIFKRVPSFFLQITLYLASSGAIHTNPVFVKTMALRRTGDRLSSIPKMNQGLRRNGIF